MFLSITGNSPNLEALATAQLSFLRRVKQIAIGTANKEDGADCICRWVRRGIFKAGNNLKAAPLYTLAIKQDPNNAALDRKNPCTGALTNIEVLNFFLSRGASKEVAVTIAPSEYKVFEYLNGTVASHQTTESVSVLMDKVKKYDLAKSEVLNIINLRPTLPVGVYTIVENCDVRLGEEGAQELVDMVTDLLPLPSRRGGS